MPKQAIPSPQSLVVFGTYKVAINRSLEAYLATLPALFAHVAMPEVATHAMEFLVEYSLRPGKRVRGALAALAYDNLTKQHLSQNGQKLAVAMELIQSYLLIVDDVTDKSALRRGEPTVHRLYEKRYASRLTERDAEQMASYTGMITGHIANLALLDADETHESIIRTLRYINRNLIVTGFGQLDDIMQEISREATHDEIIRKYALKTSHYTFIGPLQAGMALAGVTDETAYAQVGKFGEAAGVAFQTHDDYLGVFGGDETGKPVIDDIKEGKLTILVQYALEHGASGDVGALRRYLGNGSIGERELIATRAILDRTGATMEARQVEQRYAAKAIEQLKPITIWDDTFKSLLAELVTYSINRKS